MRITVILFSVLCLLCSTAVTLLYYPIRIHILRNGDLFCSDFYYLFFRVPLYNSACPIDPTKFTRRKFRKKLKEIGKKSRQNGRHVLYDNRPTQDIAEVLSRVLYHIKLSANLLRVLKKRKLPKLRIHIRRFVFLLHTEDPATTAVLATVLQNIIYGSAAIIADFFPVSYPRSEFYVGPIYSSATSLDFAIVLSIPAISYFRLFGFLPPNDDRVLEVLKKYRQSEA